MCDGQGPADVPGALVMLDCALQALAAADAGSLPTGVQAQALRALERAEARHTAARAQILDAFTAQDGYEDDGHGCARVWLAWQTRVTKAAAAGSVGWARRLAAHPVIARALADGELSTSWARAVCAPPAKSAPSAGTPSTATAHPAAATAHPATAPAHPTTAHPATPPARPAAIMTHRATSAVSQTTPPDGTA
jgi:hypothetical protein